MNCAPPATRGSARSSIALTGTGFPKVFYLKYHLYSSYFPMMALARYADARGDTTALPNYRADI